MKILDSVGKWFHKEPPIQDKPTETVENFVPEPKIPTDGKDAFFESLRNYILETAGPQWMIEGIEKYISSGELAHHTAVKAKHLLEAHYQYGTKRPYKITIMVDGPARSGKTAISVLISRLLTKVGIRTVIATEEMIPVAREFYNIKEEDLVKKIKHDKHDPIEIHDYPA